MKHKVWFDETKGILYLKLAGTFTEKDGSRYIPQMEMLYQDKKNHYLLCDLSEGGTELPTDKSYRKWLIDKYNQIGFDKIAMYNAKPSMRMLAKIVLAAAGKSKQIKFFTSITEATDWLREESQIAVEGAK